MKTLPDYLAPGLRILSIGLNPSLNSVRAGFYFATRQNRFWKALNASRLVNEPVEPGVAGIERLFVTYRIGFTDVVKRPTPGAAQLRAKDFREWAPALSEKLTRFQPAVAWFHGKLAYNNFRRYADGGSAATQWGLQPSSPGLPALFVTPNPSPANAVFSLSDLIGWFDALAAFCARQDEASSIN
ncbi:MAG: mismatch-specific DNA-glycosylase [Gammaproteobacteria bacterium]|jgi:TDG/mug DNA glycosylase family protein